MKRRVACQAREAETVLGLNSRVLEEAASADIFRTNSQIADILHVCILPEKKSLEGCLSVRLKTTIP